jgi:heme A synthase
LNQFRLPPIRSIKLAVERLSVAILVSVALVQVTTGFLNVLNWYPLPWYFVTVHRFLAYVLVGSILLHAERPDQREFAAASVGLRRRPAQRC